MSPTIIALLAALAGIVAGSLITAWLVRRPGNPTSPSALKEELETYREQVADHFADTAALVNRMTDSYKEVFDHLESGASRLIDEERLKQKLLDQSDETITLNRLGSSGSASTLQTTVDVEEQTDTAPDAPAEQSQTEGERESGNESEGKTDTEQVDPPTAAHS